MATATQIQCLVYPYYCPFCRAKMKQSSYQDEIGSAVITVEEWSKCPNGCYEFGHSYGLYEKTLGDRVWECRHDTPQELCDAQDNEIADVIIEELRRRAKIALA